MGLTPKQSNPRRAPGEPKSERLEFRVTPSTKKVIQRAAAVSGLSAADLAYEGARRILQEQEQMELSEADRKIFFKALLTPLKPPPRLVNAFRRHATEVERRPAR